MTKTAHKRPHFRRPPIVEQAITLNFERIRDFDIVDPGLFYNEVREQFPVAETGARFQMSVELFEGRETHSSLSVTPGLVLPRAIFRNLDSGELIQVQDDCFVFNWVRPSEDAQYPRFERTSSRLWELFERWVAFIRSRHGSDLILRQCEMTNVNVIPVSDFGRDFDDMGRAFIVDPFAWNVEGLVAETYVRRRVHRIVDDRGEPLGRLHSVITPAFSEANEKTFHLELTARSGPGISTYDDAQAFIERAHTMINGAFLASITPEMRAHWGEEDGE